MWTICNSWSNANLSIHLHITFNSVALLSTILPSVWLFRLALQRSALSVLALLSTLFAMIALLHTHTHTHMQSLTRTHTLLHWRAEKSFCSHTEWVRGDWERKNEREGERQRETENCRRVRSPSGQELFSVHTYVRMQVSVCVCVVVRRLSLSA